MADPLLKRSDDGPSPFARALGSVRRPTSDARPFPGVLGEKGLKFRLRLLSDDENTKARATALVYLQKFFKALDKDTPAELYLSADDAFYFEEFERQILAMALRDANDPDSPLADVGELRMGLGADERKCLIQCYVDFVDERSPLRKIKTPEEMKELIVTLGKEPSSSAFLSCCDGNSVRSLCRDMAAELTRLMSANSPIAGSSS